MPGCKEVVKIVQGPEVASETLKYFRGKNSSQDKVLL